MLTMTLVVIAAYAFIGVGRAFEDIELALRDPLRAPMWAFQPNAPGFVLAAAIWPYRAFYLGLRGESLPVTRLLKGVLSTVLPVVIISAVFYGILAASGWITQTAWIRVVLMCVLGIVTVAILNPILQLITLTLSLGLMFVVIWPVSAIELRMRMNQINGRRE